MEQILNTQERNIAFWKYLGFFIITIVLIVTAVYFNYGVQAKETSFFRERAKANSLETSVQQHYNTTVSESLGLIDSLGKENTSEDFMNAQIATKLTELKNMQFKDSSIYSRMNRDALTSLLELHKYKKEWLKSKMSSETIKKLQETVDKYNVELSDAKRDLDLCRKASGL